MPALPIVRGTCTIGHSITQLIDPLPSACAHSSGKRGRHRGYMSDGVGARKTLAGAFGVDGLSSAQKFGRGGLVACAWRCDLARGARRSPSRCVCVACAACRVSRACLSGGVGRERMLVQKVRATAVDPKHLSGKVGGAAHRRVRHGVQHHWAVRACVRWASRDSRVQSRVRARVKAASVRCSGPAREIVGRRRLGFVGMGGAPVFSFFARKKQEKAKGRRC